MKKEMAKKSLNLKKLKISKLNNLNGIHGGRGTGVGVDALVGTGSAGAGGICHSDYCRTRPD
jgi:hypothetical protein